jgi:hypothetical protein
MKLVYIHIIKNMSYSDEERAFREETNDSDD